MNNSFFAAIWAFIKANKFAVAFTFAGIILAVLFISIGFWRTVLILALACAGCGVGLLMDGRLRKQKDDGNPFGFDN